MIRAVSLLPLVVFAFGNSAAMANEGFCAVNGAGTASAALNAAVFAWTASTRCKLNGPADQQRRSLECSYDVLSTVNSLSNMANSLVEALSECDALQDGHECGDAVGGFIAASSGLSANIVNTVDVCKKKPETKTASVAAPAAPTKPSSECVTDLTQAVENIFTSVNSLMKVKDGCKDEGDRQCATNALDILDAILAFGSGALSAVNDCGPSTLVGGNAAECTGSITGAVGDLSGLAQAAMNLQDTCSATRLRLFAKINVNAATSSPTNAMWAILLPLGAFVCAAGGFLGGMRWKRNRKTKEINYSDLDDSIVAAEEESQQPSSQSEQFE